MTEYQKQAKDFLENRNITFDIKFIRCGKYFPDDKEDRDIYCATFERQNKNFSIMFGDSISNTMARKEKVHNYFNAITKNPRAYDILACITKCDPGTLENFADDFGYIITSIRELKNVEKIYNSVCEEWQKVSGFFTKAEIKKLQEIN